MPANGQTAGQPSYAELLAMVQRLELERSQPKSSITVTIGEKGGISVSGTGRFPITQYAEQWFKFLDGIGYAYSGTGIDLRRQVATHLSKGEVKVKGSKDESAESILKRSMALGHEVLAKLNAVPASVPVVATPASAPTVAQPVKA